MNLERLYQRLAELDSERFYEIASDFCAALYYQIPANQKPPCVIAFLTLENWLAMSLRSGVWTFYESWAPQDIQVTLQYLKQGGNEELAQIFATGIHNDQDARYAKRLEYPEEWICEANTIDRWILKHENWLYQWEMQLLLENKTFICSLQTAHTSCKRS